MPGDADARGNTVVHTPLSDAYFCRTENEEAVITQVVRWNLVQLDYQTPADYARTLTAAIARPAARDESSARRAIA